MTEPGLLRALVLLWLAGSAMRVTILAVPPVIRLIHDDLALSETQVGLLSSLPLVLFAAAAIPGSLLIARVGARTALLIALVICAAGGAVRGLGTSTAMLYFGTVATAFGIAVMQPALPPLVRTWAPQRMGFATAVYTNGLLIGENLPPIFTVPLVLPLLAGSWQWSFAFWSVPVALVALAIALFAPPAPGPIRGAAAAASETGRWMPDFSDPRLWRLGLYLGMANSVYFALNAFLPDFFAHTGRPEMIHPALVALNFGQIPASIFMLLSAERLVRSVWSYLGLGLIYLAGLLAIMGLDGPAAILAAGIAGFAGGGVFVLVFALPPLMAAPQDVHRFSAGIFTISYSFAVLVPILGGALWDATGWTYAPFALLLVCVGVLIGLGPTIVLRRPAASTA